MGSGPVLVKAANWMTHLDYDVESPVWRHWLEGLAAGRTLLRYDERGCGLSDWNVDRFNFDDWVDDLELVVDAEGLETLPAARRLAGRRRRRRVRRPAPGPGRAPGPRRRLRPRPARPGEHRGRSGGRPRSTSSWPESAGRDEPSFRQVFTTQFLPDGTREQWEAFNDLQRRTTSPANAVRFLQTFTRIDVTGLAPQVRCPTLMLHSRDDQRQPLAQAKELAALIPGCRLVPLPSRNHILTDFEPAWPMFLGEIDRFLLRLIEPVGGLGAADEAAGSGAGRLAVAPDLGAGHERVQVALGALQQPPAAGRQVVVDLRAVQAEAGRSRSR